MEEEEVEDLDESTGSDALLSLKIDAGFLLESMLSVDYFAMTTHILSWLLSALSSGEIKGNPILSRFSRDSDEKDQLISYAFFASSHGRAEQ